MLKGVLIKSSRRTDYVLILQEQDLVQILATVACFDTWDSHEPSMVFASLFIIGFFKKVSCLRQKKKRKKTCQENLKPHLVLIQPSYL